MNWHYMDGDKQIGPVAHDAMTALFKAGVLQGSTPVWRDGMPKWVELRETALAGQVKTPAPTVTPPPFQGVSDAKPIANPPSLPDEQHQPPQTKPDNNAKGRATGLGCGAWMLMMGVLVGGVALAGGFLPGVLVCIVIAIIGAILKRKNI
jgi:hypothetical protein